ncbi:hypothetical protein HY407_01420 [Candidatus Gottesmanbacteria bacterium]|nr:hypothetical protein [Candidatus Gottesmanbacteria bacterium]
MNNSAPLPNKATSSSPPIIPVVSTTGSSAKEKEGVSLAKTADVQVISPEVVVEGEVEKSGVVRHPERVEIPPDLAKMGVSHAGSTVPAASVPTQTIVLPVSDDQVFMGLHQPIISALRWLAEWSLKHLKAAHYTLKKVHGKIMRVPIK